jgi:crotonobetainyl-CoA:carnitine CoA-transferase CaiB-like acyl-CoA transferase
MANQGNVRPRALEGIRVIDLTWLQVGPQATRLLASFGAQVIRIEWRKRGAIDFLRYFQPFAPNHATPDGGRVQGAASSQGIRGNYDRGAYFNNTNPGKYGVTLNLNHPKGRDLLKRMVRDANALCENFSPGQMDKWGLGYEELRKLNPGLIYLQTTGMGKAGVYKNYVSYGPTAQAFSGLTFLSGLPDQDQPAGWGYSYLDHSPGYFGAMLLMAALRRQRADGRGAYIDLSQTETGLILTGTSIVEYQQPARARSVMATGCRTTIGRRTALIDVSAKTTGSRYRYSRTRSGTPCSRKWDRRLGRATTDSQLRSAVNNTKMIWMPSSLNLPLNRIAMI